MTSQEAMNTGSALLIYDALFEHTYLIQKNKEITKENERVIKRGLKELKALNPYNLKNRGVLGNQGNLEKFLEGSNIIGIRPKKLYQKLSGKLKEIDSYDTLLDRKIILAKQLYPNLDFLAEYFYMKYSSMTTKRI